MVQKLLKIVSLASLLVHTVCNYLGSANLATSNLSPPFVVGLRTRRPSWSRLENGPSTIILDDCLICNSFLSSCNRLVLLVLAGSCCIPNIVVFFLLFCDSLEKWQRVRWLWVRLLWFQNPGEVVSSPCARKECGKATTPHHACSLCIHCGDVAATVETYDLMSRKFFTHATPISSILAHRNLRCLLAFSWRWKRTALRASMIPWSNARWSPNQFLCFNYHTNTYSDTCKWLHKADDMICQIHLIDWIRFYWGQQLWRFFASKSLFQRLWCDLMLSTDIKYLKTDARTIFFSRVQLVLHGSSSKLGMPAIYLSLPRLVALVSPSPTSAPVGHTSAVPMGTATGWCPCCGTSTRRPGMWTKGGGKRKGSFAMCLGTLDIWDGFWGRVRAGCLGYTNVDSLMMLLMYSLMYSLMDSLML